MLELHSAKEASTWLKGRVTGCLHTDSRKVGRGDGFIAWPGAATDGRRHVHAALKAGATACLVERAQVAPFQFGGEAIATYEGLKADSGPIASAYYDNPSQQLDVVAVTGTNGKTSITWWLANLLSNLELSKPIPCGHIGTLGIGHPKNFQSGLPPAFELRATGLTTPDPVLLQQQLREFSRDGMQACALEASSIGLEERRLDGTRIHTAVFTNFTQDHLDYHGDMQAYWQAKAALFQWPGLKAAVVNIDDAKGRKLAASLQPDAVDVWTVSCRGPARLQADQIALNPQGLAFVLQEAGQRHLLRTGLVGHYNVENLLCVIASMRSLGVPLAACLESCRRLVPVPGRMERVAGDSMGSQAAQPWVAVDYAHTPDALAQALQALRPLAQQRGGQLWCVFGCGGDRDAAKRPLMGAAAALGADQVVVTSDNPRSEPPQAIVDQILAGISNRQSVSAEVDRAIAIGRVLARAKAQDVVLIAGKGHENTQDIAGVKLPFSDQAQAAQALRSWQAAQPAAGAPA